MKSLLKKDSNLSIENGSFKGFALLYTYVARSVLDDFSKFQAFVLALVVIGQRYHLENQNESMLMEDLITKSPRLSINHISKLSLKYSLTNLYPLSDVAK
jgi:hypothetical protein